jgi:hypothetical protein
MARQGAARNGGWASRFTIWAVAVMIVATIALIALLAQMDGR